MKKGTEMQTGYSDRWRWQMKYKVRLEHTEEGVSVSVPGLPGCWSEGADEGEALANIREAIREYLSAVDDLLDDAEVREIDVVV